MAEMEKSKLSRRRTTPSLFKHQVFGKMIFTFRTFLATVTLGYGIFVAGMTWVETYDPEEQRICPKRILCASTPFELVMMTVSRFTAGLIVPSMLIACISKANNTRALIQHSSIGTVVDFEPTHPLHILYGHVFLWASFAHSVAHIVRLVAQDGAAMLINNSTSRAGLVAIITLFIGVVPMSWDFLKQKLSYEIRKATHYVILVSMSAVCFHSYFLRIFSAVILIIVVGDMFYFHVKGTHLVESPTYEPVGGGTSVMMNLPVGYTFKAGSYVYVMCPAINPLEWHALSLIPAKSDDVEDNRGCAVGHGDHHTRAALYIAGVGDWTKGLFRLALQKSRMPLWISDPMPSAMQHALDFDNVLLVATGVGITPCISVIERYAYKKNIHLLWVVREASLVSLYEDHLRQVNSTVHLTGSQEPEIVGHLKQLIESRGNRDSLDSNASDRAEGVCHRVILREGRPDLPEFLAKAQRGEVVMTPPLSASPKSHQSQISSQEMSVHSHRVEETKVDSCPTPEKTRVCEELPVPSPLLSGLEIPMFVKPPKMEISQQSPAPETTMTQPCSRVQTPEKGNGTGVGNTLREITFQEDLSLAHTRAKMPLTTAQVTGDSGTFGRSSVRRSHTPSVMRAAFTRSMRRKQSLKALQAPDKDLVLSSFKGMPPVDPATESPLRNLPWVVLYSGANMAVSSELAVASQELGMAYRREWDREW